MRKVNRAFSIFVVFAMCIGLFSGTVSAENDYAAKEPKLKTVIYQEDFSEDYSYDVAGGYPEFVGTETTSGNNEKNYSVFDYSNSSNGMSIAMNSTNKLLSVTAKTVNDKGVLFINRNMLYNQNWSANREINITAKRDASSSINTSFGMRLRSHAGYNKDYYEAGITTSYCAPGGYAGTDGTPDRPYILKCIDMDTSNGPLEGEGSVKGTYYLYTFPNVPRLQQNELFDLTSGVITEPSKAYDRIYIKGRYVAKGDVSSPSGSETVPANSDKGILGGGYSWTTEAVGGVTYVDFYAYIIDSKRFNIEADDVCASQSGITLVSQGGAESLSANAVFNISSLNISETEEVMAIPEFDLTDGKAATTTFEEPFNTDVEVQATDDSKNYAVTDDWQIRSNINGYWSTRIESSASLKKMTMTQNGNGYTGVLELIDLENKGLYKNPNHEITVNAERGDDGSNGVASIQTAFGLRLKGTGVYKKTYYETGVSSSWESAGTQYEGFDCFIDVDRPYILKVVDRGSDGQYSAIGNSSNATVYNYKFSQMPRLKQWEPFSITGGVVSGETNLGVKYDKIYVKGSYEVRDQGGFANVGYIQLPADDNISGGAYKYSVENNICSFEGYVIDIKPFYAYDTEANNPASFTSGISLCATQFSGLNPKFDITGVTLKRLGDEVFKPSVTAASANGTVTVSITNAADIMASANITDAPVAICVFYSGDKLIDVKVKAVENTVGTQVLEFTDPQTAGAIGKILLWNSVVNGEMPIYSAIDIN